MDFRRRLGIPGNFPETSRRMAVALRVIQKNAKLDPDQIDPKWTQVNFSDRSDNAGGQKICTAGCWFGLRIALWF